MPENQGLASLDADPQRVQLSIICRTCQRKCRHDAFPEEIILKTQLPVGVIGLGRMGQIYAGHLARRIPQSRLVSVAAVIEERARVKAI